MNDVGGHFKEHCIQYNYTLLMGDLQKPENFTILSREQYNRGTMDRDFTVYVNLRTI
jgi:hypothetical protein